MAYYERMASFPRELIADLCHKDRDRHGPALKSLAADQMLPSKTVSEALTRYEIDPARASPALT